MSEDILPSHSASASISPEHQAELDTVMRSGRGPRWTRAAITFMSTAIVSAVSGASSFIVGVITGGIGAAAAFWSEAGQQKDNELFAGCIQEMQGTMNELQSTVARIIVSINTSEDQFADRVEDPRYQSLIRKAFAGWSRGESEEKREMIRRLLSHAAEMPDPDYNLFNLFFDWLRRYNELHFRLIRSLKEQGTATKLQIWEGMGGTRVRDDSAEADVFGCLFMDLNFGHVVRKVGGRDSAGRRVRAAPVKRNSPYLKSVLDNNDLQQHTAVGELFIHYAMDELIDKLPGPPSPRP
jgi:hypothetical protein